MSVKAPRKNTPTRTEKRPDGSTVISGIVIKRACNGCDRELPDARDECPDCSTE